MKRVLTAVVLIPLVLLLVFKAHPALLLLAVGGISYFCLREFVEIARGHALRPLTPLLFTLVLLPYLVPPLLSLTHVEVWYSAPSLFFPLAISSPLFFLVGAMFRKEPAEALPDAAVSMLGFLYVGVGLFSVWSLSTRRDLGSLLILWLLVAVWSGDISAYYVGSYLGRHKLAPRISPNKTWEGAIASLVVATALGSAILLNLLTIHNWLSAHHLLSVDEISAGGPPQLPAYPIWFALTASMIVNISAQFGDLAESTMKRGANLKDSGTLVPGHGGLLDRLDALLFAGPTAMLVFALFELLTMRVVS